MLDNVGRYKTSRLGVVAEERAGFHSTFVHIINGWIAPEGCVLGPPQKFFTASSSSAFQPLPIPEFRLGESSS
jgi:hypothetical protein